LRPSEAWSTLPPACFSEMTPEAHLARALRSLPHRFASRCRSASDPWAGSTGTAAHGAMQRTQTARLLMCEAAAAWAGPAVQSESSSGRRWDAKPAGRRKRCYASVTAAGAGRSKPTVMRTASRERAATPARRHADERRPGRRGVDVAEASGGRCSRARRRSVGATAGALRLQQRQRAA